MSIDSVNVTKRCLVKSGKVDFRRFLVFTREGKSIFADFRSSYPYESLLFPFFVHRTPTKASFFRFSFVVPLRKLLFPVFRSSYPYESFFFPFFVHRTSYLDNFSRKLMIYSRIWTDFPENRQFTPVSGLIFLKTDDLLPYLD